MNLSKLTSYLKMTRGFSLASAMVSTTIAGISIMMLAQMLSISGGVERGIASNSELSNLKRKMLLILESPESCAKTGLVDDTTIDDISHPESTPISILLPNSTTKVLAQTGVSVGHFRKITSLRISSMVELRELENGNKRYFSTLSVNTTQSKKNVFSSRSPSFEVHLKLDLDETNTIRNCYATAADVTIPSPPPEPLYPIGAVVQVSINSWEYLHLAEVAVFAEDEVTRIQSQGVATQTSTYGVAVASKGNDGKYWNGEYTHTNNSPQEQTWALTFSEPQRISKIKVYNRQDGWGFRLNGAIVKILDEQGTEVFSGNIPSATNGSIHEFIIDKR